MAKRVGKDNFEAEVLSSEIPVILDFYSDTCIPCRAMSPVLGNIEDNYEGRLKVAKVNVTADAQLASDFGVSSTPTILFFENGKETGRVSGVVPENEILKMAGVI